MRAPLCHCDESCSEECACYLCHPMDEILTPFQESDFCKPGCIADHMKGQAECVVVSVEL